MNNTERNKLYKAIKLHHEGGECYKGRDLKLRQLKDYKIQMDAVLSKLSKKQTLHLVESCSGNCYLTFYLAWHYREIYKDRIKYTCIERNSRLITEAQKTAQLLGLENIEFISANVEDILFTEKVHIVYSLHACDSATDATIALGVNCSARYIMSVSCCQHRMHKKLKGHQLTALTRHGVYKEQLSHMIADSMRACYIARFCYESDIFAFTSTKKHRPKYHAPGTTFTD